MWTKLKKNKHKILSWILLIVVISEAYGHLPVTWEKALQVIMTFVVIEYYAFAEYGTRD